MYADGTAVGLSFDGAEASWPQKSRASAADLLDLVGLDPGTYGAHPAAQLLGGSRTRCGAAGRLLA
ncbi:hypothetical protein GPZ77_30460 [Streptomyces sp. QHH-9511]|uniref:hypothetical protein n=1 Tax=Streptomyces sp. QHH-9511 TaxID=2684468 RepID=UPI001318D2FF|nr:hypothetical protein [Streptomyces sp. QHH-9511]QGZ52112.1 hypothetical protein GPZ77_30460 [Streptomyces sp. QHH-9511]